MKMGTPVDRLSVRSLERSKTGRDTMVRRSDDRAMLPNDGPVARLREASTISLAGGVFGECLFVTHGIQYDTTASKSCAKVSPVEIPPADSTSDSDPLNPPQQAQSPNPDSQCEHRPHFRPPAE